MKLMIFIPAYKTRNTVCNVIDKIPKNVMEKTYEIVVIDNKSPDGTYEALLDYKKKNKISKLKVFQNPKNLGFGGNLKAGFEYAVSNKMDVMVVLHSDGQYPSSHIEQLIKPIEEGKAQTSFGSRFLGNPRAGGMPIWRFLGNIFLTQVENILINRNFSEWHSGFCAYDVNALKTLPFRLCESGYELTTDILLLFISNKYKIAEIEIPTHYGKESTSPSITRTFLYFVNSFRLALIFFLHRTKLIKVKKYVPTRTPLRT